MRRSSASSPSSGSRPATAWFIVIVSVSFPSSIPVQRPQSRLWTKTRLYHHGDRSRPKPVAMAVSETSGRRRLILGRLILGRLVLRRLVAVVRPHHFIRRQLAVGILVELGKHLLAALIPFGFGD